MNRTTADCLVVDTLGPIRPASATVCSAAGALGRCIVNTREYWEASPSRLPSSAVPRAGADAPAIVPRATTMLLIFALLGAVVGRLGLWTVEEGVAARLRDELASSGKSKN